LYSSVKHFPAEWKRIAAKTYLGEIQA
jgi:hypothetical protein